jgi:AraC-like DNA-binding protein
MNATLRDALLTYTRAHPPGPNGITRTGVEGLAIVRSDAPTPLEHLLYEPALIVVVDGAKELMLGDTLLTYTPGHYLVLSVGLPLLASITRASAAAPYLALALTIDLPLIGDLIRELPPAPLAAAGASTLGLFIGDFAPHEFEAVARIGALLAQPDALRVLFPSIARELYYWLLSGAGGAEFCRLAAPDSHARRIAAAIAALRSQLTVSVPVERLAEIAHMSPSSFHHHFKAVTAMSPLQYQKQLRLLEARRLMLAGTADATRAAYEVGYESTTQFSREYARLFGAPPRRDITGFRTPVG